MNQIIYTENNNENGIDKRKVITIFCIAVAIVAIIILSLSSYHLYNNIQNRKKLAKPQISINRINEEQISIDVKCEDGINFIVLKWNETDDNTINLNGSAMFQRVVDIPYNRNNSLKIEVESVNKIKAEITQDFEMEVDEEKPTIDSISIMGSELNIKASDNSGIDYLEYQWEEEETKKIEADISNNKSIDAKIEIERGTHKLSIIVVDIFGNQEKISRLITGVNEPEIEVIKYDNVINIKITHDMGIKQVNVLINDKLYTYDENSPEYSHEKTIELEYPLTEGENLIKIIAYSMEKLSEDGEEDIDNLSYKTYVGTCTYEIAE